MAKKTKRQEQADRARVSRIYGRVAHGVQIPVASLSAVMAAGMAALDAGGDDSAIGAAVSAKVGEVRADRAGVLADEALVDAAVSRMAADRGRRLY